MRKPPAIRQMRSTCSGVATPSCTSRSASSPNGRLQRLTRKPGASAASITRLPIASPASRATASASAADSAPATTSTSRILGGGLKKCMPTTRSGCGTPAASAVTLSDEVLVASTQSALDDGRELGEQRALELEVLGRRLDHQLAARERLQVPHRLGALRRPRERLRVGVVEQGLQAGAGRERGDPAPIVPAPATPTARITPAR